MPTPPIRAGHLNIKSSGTASNPLVYDGHGSGIEGAEISGSYVVLKNYDISVQSNDWPKGYGVYISGDHVRVEGNYIHDLCNSGIETSGADYAEIVDNKIERASMAGISQDGDHNTIEGNEIWDTQQHPRKAGGVTSNCTDLNGADADGFRFFGSHNKFKNNYIHDIKLPSSVNIDPHVDCFQTFEKSSTSDVIFTGNRCIMQAVYSQGAASNHVAMIEAARGPTFDHNVFSNMYQGIINGSAEIHILNNTFDHISKYAVEPNCCGHSPTSNDEIKKNIMLDDGSAYTSSTEPSLSGNVCWNRSGTKCSSSWPSATSVNPQFVNPGSGQTPWLSCDLHLQADSPVPLAGAYPLQ
jgi:hypothetical protein